MAREIRMAHGWAERQQCRQMCKGYRDRWINMRSPLVLANRQIREAESNNRLEGRQADGWTGMQEGT
jgi:hypothetical protein